MPEDWIPWVAGAFGLALGSFLNVCTLRWPLGGSVVRPPSRCPGCDTPIAPRDNVPVLGWILLRGRCRTCGNPISIQYPLVEAATALLWAGAFHHGGLGWDGLAAAVFLTLLLGIAVSDARFYIIPDEFSLGGAVVGFALSFAPGGRGPVSSLAGAALGFLGFHIVGVLGTWLVRLRNPARLEEAFDAHDEQRADPVVQARVARLAGPGARWGLVALTAAAAAVAAVTGGAGAVLVALPAALAGVAILLAWAESFEDATFEPERAAARGDAPPEDAPPADAPVSALGGGDIRMMAMVGAFLGPAGVVLTTLGGSLLALVAAVPLSLVFRQLIPLGIFLAYAAAASWLWGDDLVAWYLRFAGFGG